MHFYFPIFVMSLRLHARVAYLTQQANTTNKREKGTRKKKKTANKSTNTIDARNYFSGGEGNFSERDKQRKASQRENHAGVCVCV
jgi:hypothetical protein